MTPYKNLSGHSGVVAYAIKDDAIHVRFRDGDAPNYLYDAASVGKDKLATMKKLAQAGRGLSTFISQQVGGNYASRW
jgi:hypothetical protein